MARLTAERTRRDELYSKFLQELARLYSHAVKEEKIDFSQLVDVYALRGRILLQSTDKVSQCADAAITYVLEIYLAPNKSDEEILYHTDQQDPMKPFAAACREELAGLR